VAFLRRTWKKTRGVSIFDVAELLGVSIGAASNMLQCKGVRRLTVAEMEKVWNLLVQHGARR